MKKKQCYWIYILQVSNGNYYTGYTNNLIRRYEEHVSGTASRYTKSHPPVRIIQCWKIYEDQGSAMKVESLIKRKSRKIKDEIVENPKKLKKMALKSSGLNLNIRVYNPARLAKKI